MTNILRGLGDSKTPMYFLIISCFINIIFNLLFIKYLNYGISGAAWATIIAQTFAFLGVFIYSSIKYPNYRIHLFHPLFKIYALKSILKYSVPSTMQEIFRSIGLMSLQIIINGFGTGCIAAYTVVSKIDSFAQLPTINLGRALTNYTAQNLGAKREDRIKKGFKAAFVIGLTVIMTITAFVLLSPDFLIKIFSRDSEVILIGRTYLRIVGMAYSVSLLMHLLNGILLGYEKTFVPMLATIISLCIIQVPSALLLSSTRLGYIGIWIATPLGWIGGVLIRYYYYRKIVIKQKYFV
jgi:putative MATE family efflux protein